MKIKLSILDKPIFFKRFHSWRGIKHDALRMRGTMAYFWTTEVNLARRPTGYIPTPANANFALGSDAVRGQHRHHITMSMVASWKSCILRPGGQGFEIPLAVMLWKLVKLGILMDFYDAQHFQILCTLLGKVWNHLITLVTRRHHRNRPDYFLSEMHNEIV